MMLSIKLFIVILYVYCCEYVEFNQNYETQYERDSLKIDSSIYTTNQKLENFVSCEGIKSFAKQNESDTMLYYCIYSFSEFIETSNEDLEGYLSFLESIKWSSEENTNKNIKRSESFALLNRNNAIHETIVDDLLPFEFDKYVEEFYYSLTEYIRTTVCKIHQNTYFTRLDMIKETLIFLSESTIKSIEVFTTDIDNLLKNILESLWLKYKHFLILDNFIYDRFSDDFDIKFKEIKHLENFKAAQRMICNRRYLHLKEFITIYKYIKIFPELISLGYIATQSSFKKVTFTFRLIVLFLTQNEHDLIKNRIFIMFLLKKAFSSTAKCNLDHIYTLNLQESNPSSISRLFFFSWEFNHKQRARQKIRIDHFYDSSRYYHEEDRIHYDIVLRLYFFQHLIYLRYENVKKNEFEKFKNFIENADSYERQFYQFIKMF